jgi:peptidoglycan hydrolase-like protein with peptidoglycan-binding domain
MKTIFFLFLILSLLPLSVDAGIYYENPPISIQIMGYGATGESVVLLQQTLQRLGYFPFDLAVTGYYGMTTARAVQGFQRAHGIVATGHVGPCTQAALMNYAVLSTPVYTSYASCIPADLMLDRYEAASIRERLRGLDARCRDGMLYSGNGKPIYVYHMKGCWGNAPYNYREILRDQSEEIAALRNRYTVIQIPCTVGGDMVY